jgi:hypothetical protein
MKEITAEDKDRILGWFYEADVNGNVVPTGDKNLDICAILESDGYIEKGEYRHVITLKGRSFYPKWRLCQREGRKGKTNKDSGRSQ